MAYPPLGVQLIVFSKQLDLERDTEVVLDAVKASGFGAIECGATMRADDPQQFKAMLDQRGLRVSGLHDTLSVDLDKAFRLMEVYDTQDLCISGIGEWGTCDIAIYTRDIDKLNTLARTCHEHGVHLHYHNHAYEFAHTSEGMSGMDLLLGNLDFGLASLCVDVAWVHIGGQDPATFLRKNASRVGYVHLKDYIRDRHWVELGQGRVPLDSVMKALPDLSKVRWTVYEQDTSDRAAAESCKISYQYLASMINRR